MFMYLAQGHMTSNLLQFKPKPMDSLKYYLLPQCFLKYHLGIPSSM